MHFIASHLDTAAAGVFKGAGQWGTYQLYAPADIRTNHFNASAIAQATQVGFAQAYTCRHRVAQEVALGVQYVGVPDADQAGIAERAIYGEITPVNPDGAETVGDQVTAIDESAINPHLIGESDQTFPERQRTTVTFL